MTSESTTLLLNGRKYQAALQIMYLSTHRSLKLLILFKEASACRGQRLTQKLTAVQSAENKFLWSAQP